MSAPRPSETDASEASPLSDAATPGITGALARWRVLAYIVGVGLLALVAAMIAKYSADEGQYMRVIGPVHGFLYAVYLVLAIDLALKARWSMKGTVLVLLAGVVPFVSFYAERQVTRKVRAGEKL
ncbi:integral membrane protein [Herbihabitans rhizosphaerae]|uniref:Integral membrane protein n=1 Tax=Herbihabitans rhizosphaerae TaxID=1872711 RepID=A0A4Q7KK27_9PSEU|nr:DUF3817 domain-containing protein [Herbihabitans rhizosphaerae]RZS34256.1 integral membrane protein [Herbihabitans rhizosphaerae]